jgi:hypothetical protein
MSIEKTSRPDLSLVTRHAYPARGGFYDSSHVDGGHRNDRPAAQR